MENDFLGTVREKILNEDDKSFPRTPADLTANYESEGGWAGLLAGLIVGATVGANFGIAGGPLGAIAGTVPGAIIGASLGYFGGAKAGSNIEAESK